MKRRTFNLRLWFAICSLSIITLLCATAAVWLDRYLTDSILQREGKLSQEYLESIVKVNGPETFRDDGEVNAPKNPMLLDLSEHLLSLPGVIRINVHSVNRRVLWSTEKQLVGKIFGDNGELDEAFGGKIVTEISRLEDDLKSEHIELGTSGSIIESYIPIRENAGKGKIIGVIETYRLPLSLETLLKQGRQTIWTGAAGAALVLFLSLYWIVQRGAVIIEGQQDSMGRMEALAAIGQMASAIAHSLRNPMSAIRSSAELWHAQQPVDNRRETEEVMAEVDRMDRYVRDLLAYARSDTQKLQVVDPAKIINSILDRQARAAERNQVVLQRPVGIDPTLRVLADEMLLEQALTSLVTNAIEAMPDGGQLQIAVTPRPKGRIKIEITDNGRGIPANLLDRVAESYFTTKTRGLGLGLVLAKGIIEKFDGALEINSAAGAGTNVVVELKAG